MPSRAVRAQPPPGPQVIRADESGVTLDWTLPQVTLAAVKENGATYTQILIPGLAATTTEAGAPQLPFFSGLVGLPPTGGASLRIVSVERELLSLPHPVLPAPTPQRIDPAEVGPDHPAFFGGPTQILPNPTRYAADEWYPAVSARLGAPQTVRGHRTASLAIYPVRVNPARGQLEVIRSIRLEINFDEPAPAGLAAQSAPDAVSRALAATLLNPAASGWQAPAPAETTGPNPPPSLAAMGGGSTTLKIVVSQAGLTALTRADLQAAGVPVDSLDPRTLQISYGASFAPVAILVEGESDGVFDSADRVLFFANPAFSRYTTEDVYFLTWGASSSPRMANRPGSPAGLPAGIAWRSAQAERNQVYEPLYQGRNGDAWTWNSLSQSCYIAGGVSSVYSISLSAPLVSATTPATLTVWLQGASTDSANPDHKTWVYFNNNFAGQTQWDGEQQKALSVPLDAGWLQNGTNTIRVTLPGLDNGNGVCENGEVLAEKTYVDAFELTYPTATGSTSQLRFRGQAGQKQYTLGGWPSAALRVLDVTDPLLPQVVSGVQVSGGGPAVLSLGDASAAPAEYLVAPESAVLSPLRLEPAQLLADPPGGADYILITHPDFAAAVAPLAAHRAGQGLRVFTADVQAVYDSFGGGRATPEAIRAFLQHAYQNWPTPKPLYVLLVGDGSYDFKNYSGFNPKNFIPPYLVDVDPWWGETASDNRLVTFGGNQVPSMLIGRLPVNSAAEAATVVGKIIGYETGPVFPGGWNARQLFVGGDSLKNPATDWDGYKWDTIGIQEASDEAYNRLVSPFSGRRFYYNANAGSSSSYIYNNYVTLRNDFLNGFEAGAGLISFTGHSSWHQWNDQPVLRWSLVPADNDVEHMSNGTRLPVVLGMTCFTGYFHHPEYPTMDEALLRQPGGGAVAVWGATGLGVAHGHVDLQAGFFDAILGGQTNLGAAVLAGKLKLQATGSNLDLLDTFTLFGDPAMTMNFTPLPFTDSLYLPLVVK